MHTISKSVILNSSDSSFSKDFIIMFQSQVAGQRLLLICFKHTEVTVEVCKLQLSMHDALLRGRGDSCCLRFCHCFNIIITCNLVGVFISRTLSMFPRIQSVIDEPHFLFCPSFLLIWRPSEPNWRSNQESIYIYIFFISFVESKSLVGIQADRRGERTIAVHPKYFLTINIFKTKTLLIGAPIQHLISVLKFLGILIKLNPNVEGQSWPALLTRLDTKYLPDTRASSCLILITKRVQANNDVEGQCCEIFTILTKTDGSK